MKLNKTCAVAVAGLATLAASSYGQGLTLNFANNTATGIQFNGASDSFQFTSTNGYQWHVTTEAGGTSAEGLFGSFGSVPFTYGPITSTGTGLTLVQQATVIGPLANLVINDGTGNLTGTVNFENIATFATATGDLNANLLINLTGVTYTGSNPDLQFLTLQPGTLDLSFNFSPGKTLTQLSSGTGPYLTSYSGSLIVVPEPASLTLAGLSGLVLLVLRRRK
jgi:hypothetical protein